MKGFARLVTFVASFVVGFCVADCLITHNLSLEAAMGIGLIAVFVFAAVWPIWLEL
jgi:hypothetical protein